MKASAMSFRERTVTPTGREGHRTHTYIWARCSLCQALRLTTRAGAKKVCAMTPGCKGRLEEAEDDQDFTLEEAVRRAVLAFDACPLTGTRVPMEGGDQ